MAKRVHSASMSDVLRRTILESKVPLLTLEQETGIHRASIRRFLAGERSLVLDKADKLAAYFGLVLTIRKDK